MTDATSNSVVIAALKEVRARVYEKTIILPDGERVVPQVVVLRILRAVIDEQGGNDD